MVKFKFVLPLAIFFCLAAQASAAEDPLGIDSLQIVDTEHSSWWHEMAGTFEEGENETEGNEAETEPESEDLAQNVDTTARDDVYVIGSGPGTNSEGPLSAEIESEPMTADFSGSWHLAMMDSIDGTTRKADLELYQTGDVIFGRGTVASGSESEEASESEDRPTQDEGIDSMIWWLNQQPADLGPAKQVAASGTVIDDSLHLDLVSLEEPILYKLDLSLRAGSIAGNYRAYSSDGVTWVGSTAGAPQN